MLAETLTTRPMKIPLRNSNRWRVSSRPDRRALIRRSCSAT
jgi:hypothetical protein